MGDKFSAYMKHQIDNINQHLPRKTLTLRQVGLLKEPIVKLRDGTSLYFESEELSTIRKSIPEIYHHRVQLPIIITRRRDFGLNAYTVGGDIGNLYIIMSIFEEDMSPFDVWMYNVPKNKVFYKVQMPKIRKIFKSTTVIAFT